MFIEGQILYFQPFYFKDGGIPENKYFVVLRNLDKQTIVASLPTSKNNAPSLITISHGCMNIDERKFNCYVFEKDRGVCDNGFCFDRHTYVYGNQVKDYEMNNLTRNNSIQDGVDFKALGILSKDEYKSVYECILNSNSTINKIKRLLSRA